MLVGPESEFSTMDFYLKYRSRLPLDVWFLFCGVMTASHMSSCHVTSLDAKPLKLLGLKFSVSETVAE